MYNNEFPSECTSYVLAVVYVSEIVHQYICNYVKKQSVEKNQSVWCIRLTTIS